MRSSLQIKQAQKKIGNAFESLNPNLEFAFGLNIKKLKCR